MGLLGLFCIGLLAFGLAVFGFDKDPTDSPSNVTERLEFAPFIAAAAAAPAPPAVFLKSERVKRNDTVDRFFQRMGVNDPAASEFLRAQPMTNNLFGKAQSPWLSVAATDQGVLHHLTARWINTDGLSFTRWNMSLKDNKWLVTETEAFLQASTRLSNGVITSSLFAATDAAGIPDSLAIELAEIFSGDIDFHRDLRLGDSFYFAHEVWEADGLPLRNGRILSAKFLNNRKILNAIWFEQPGLKGDYFTLDGHSTQKTFLSSPLAFSRVSSGYGMRYHPISGNRRPHLGVDFAAPTGTPVRTVGNGRVRFAGRQGGYGKVVFVDHNNGQTTVYAHLSRINVRVGQQLDKGDRIGAVGSTGASTGPHLHFEFRVNGKHKDPLAMVKKSLPVKLSAQAKAEFKKVANAQSSLIDAVYFSQQVVAQND